MQPRTKPDDCKNSEACLAVENCLNAEDDGVLEIVLTQPPDGGWGWVIVAASLVANIIVDGITYTFGILLPWIEDAFQQPKRTITLAGSLQVGIYLCVGPIVSALTNRYGCGKVTIAGSIVTSSGFILSIFAPNANVFILTYGIIGGIGFGMIYLPAVVFVGYYFEKRRALATGIAVCGSGIGMFIMAPTSGFLLHHLGYRGTLLVLAGFVLNAAVCGFLMRPLPVTLREKNYIRQSMSNGNGSMDVEASSRPLLATSEQLLALSSPVVANQDIQIVVLDDWCKSAEKELPSLKHPAIKTVIDPSGFSSHPNMMFLGPNKSCKDTDASFRSSHGLNTRCRSNTLYPSCSPRFRHRVTRPDVESSSAMTPMGLSYVGLSDASINLVRASTQLHVSRMDVLLSSGGSVLHIPDHNIQQSVLRSGLSMYSHHSNSLVRRNAERLFCQCLPESSRDTLLTMLDLSILKNVAFDLVLLGNVFTMLGFYVPFVFMPNKAESLGYSESRGNFLISIIGITNTVGRVLTGFLANTNKIDALIINNIAMVVCSLATFFTPFCYSYELLCLASALFGFCVVTVDCILVI